MHGPLQLTLGGDLTLHGETRPQTALARVYVNGDTLRGQGEATVRQSAYGIRLYSGLGGMLKVKDDVHLVFDILARAAPTPPESAQRGEPGTAPGDREEPRTTVQAR
jgi:hypothetical protein